MTTASVNGVQLFYELGGSGEVPVVLVHGSWSSHDSWGPVAPGLSRSFRVLNYDRRGHSQSERPDEQWDARENVADLASLIEHLGLAPAWVVGHSFGALVAIRLAFDRPELLRGVIAHEPPMFWLLAEDPAFGPVLEEVGRRVGAVVERIASGDHAGAAEQFAETVALGPGGWAMLPEQVRETMIENAPTFLGESRGPEQLAFDVSQLERFTRPALLTTGDQSPPTFPPVVAKLAGALPEAEVVTLAGAGHDAPATHADLYVETVEAFVKAHQT